MYRGCFSPVFRSSVTFSMQNEEEEEEEEREQGHQEARRHSGATQALGEHSPAPGGREQTNS